MLQQFWESFFTNLAKTLSITLRAKIMNTWVEIIYIQAHTGAFLGHVSKNTRVRVSQHKQKRGVENFGLEKIVFLHFCYLLFFTKLCFGRISHILQEQDFINYL